MTSKVASLLALYNVLTITYVCPLVDSPTDWPREQIYGHTGHETSWDKESDTLQWCITKSFDDSRSESGDRTVTYLQVSEANSQVRGHPHR
jgi:hypothetical protein